MWVTASASEVLAGAAPGLDAMALVLRGEQELSQNLDLDALATYTLAVLVDPTAASAYDGLGRSFVVNGKSDRAIACFRTALHLDPSLIETRYRLGFGLQMQGDLQQAADTWRELLNFDSNHAKAHERLAIALYYLGDYEQSWLHVHAAEALGYEVPPQFRPLLAAQMSEP